MKWFMNNGVNNRYSPRPLPGPGVQNFAYLDLRLEPQSPISGAIANRAQFRSLMPLSIQTHVVMRNGIGGLQSGYVKNTPLFVPLKEGYEG